MNKCKQCKYETAAFMPCNACKNNSEFVPKSNEPILTRTLKEFNNKLLFIDMATALIDSYVQSLNLNNLLYNFGIDVANYTDPAYKFLENFISNNYDDKYGSVIESLFALAEYGSTIINGYEATTVEEIYDCYFREART